MPAKYKVCGVTDWAASSVGAFFPTCPALPSPNLRGLSQLLAVVFWGRAYLCVILLEFNVAGRCDAYFCFLYCLVLLVLLLGGSVSTGRRSCFLHRVVSSSLHLCCCAICFAIYASLREDTADAPASEATRQTQIEWVDKSNTPIVSNSARDDD